MNAWEIPAATLLCLLLAATVTWPLASAPSGVAHDGVDTLFNTWLLAWNHHAASHLENPLHPPVFLGQPDAAGRSDLLFTQTLVAAPLRIGGLSPMGAHNVLLILSLAFAGTALFLLAREAGLDTAGSMFAAGAFVCSPFFQSHLWHLQLMSPGFALLAIRQAVRASTGRGAWWPMALLVFLQCGASLYYWLFLDAALLLFLPWAAARGGAKAVAGLLLWLAGGNVPCAAMLLGHFGSAMRWPVDTVTSTDVSAFVSPWESSRLLGRFRPASTIGEVALWPGLAAAAGSVWHVLSKRKEQRLQAGFFFAASAAVFAIICLGPTLVVFGRQLAPAPWRLLAGLPGFDAIRLPARAGFLYLVPLLLAAGAAFRGRPVLSLLGLALSLAEVWPGRMALSPVVPEPFHAWLARNRFEAIAILPVSTDMVRPESECANLYGQIGHFTPMVNGYGTSLPAGYEETARILNSWPSEQADSLIRELGIECLICKGFVPADAEPVWHTGPRPFAAVVLGR
jgi:hypothetical protein